MLRSGGRWGLCALLVAGACGAARAETLADAVAAAYDRDPQLVQERYLQKARDESYTQARAQYGPTLQASTNAGYEYSRQFGITSKGDTAQTSVSVSQPLYTSGRVRGEVAAAKANVLGGQQTLRQVEQQTVQNVVTVYAGVLRDTVRVEIGRENVEVLAGQLEQNRKRQQYGDVTITDVAQSDSRLAAAQLQLAALEADLAVSRGQYLEVVGHNPGVLEPLPQLAPPPPTIDAAFEVADANNPALRTAEYTEQASSASAAAARGAQGPTISLSGQGSYDNKSLRFDGTLGHKEAIGGITISQQIFSGGSLRSRIRQADAQNRADQAGIDIARRTALQNVTAAWVQLSAARIAVVTGQRQVDSAQTAFAGMSCEELNGLRATIETLNAEQELQNAQLELVQNRYQVYVSHAALLAAMGSLDPREIASGIAVYDPEANFERVRSRGATPLEYVIAALDRIGSPGPRGRRSAELSGEAVPHPENPGALAPSPGRALLNQPLTPITQSKLRLPNGDLGRCPLTGVRAYK